MNVRPWRRWTLRSRLLVIGLLGLAAVQATAGVVVYVALTVEGLRRVDSSTAASAREVRTLVESGRLPQTLPVTGVQVIQVLDDQGRVVSASPTADRLTAILRPHEVRDAVRGPVTVPGSRVAMSSRLRVRAYDATGPDGERVVVVGEPVDDLLDSGTVLRHTLLLSFPLLLVVLGLVAWRVMGAVLRPVEGMRAAAERISGSGRHERLPVPDSGDEVHALALTLNSMLDRLDRARDRETGFVADAAHELRSPLASMMMQLDVARRTGDDGSLVDDLSADVARLAALVDDLLVLARIDAGRVDPDAPDGTAVRPVVERAVAGHGRPVDVEAGPDAAVRLREADLLRVVTNLLDNALRHADGVRVSVVPAGDRVLVRVDDDGPGVPAADRERVFERFTRLDDARSRDDGGSGLGLAIVRELVGRAGGEVRLSDSAAGGLRAEVDLPSA